MTDCTTYRELPEEQMQEVADSLSLAFDIHVHVGVVEDLMNAFDCVFTELNGRGVAVIPETDAGHPVWAAYEVWEDSTRPWQLMERCTHPVDALWWALDGIRDQKATNAP